MKNHPDPLKQAVVLSLSLLAIVVICLLMVSQCHAQSRAWLADDINKAAHIFCEKSRKHDQFVSLTSLDQCADAAIRFTLGQYMLRMTELQRVQFDLDVENGVYGEASRRVAHDLAYILYKSALEIEE